MYVKRNTEARSYNHCCYGKAICITNCECVFVDLRIQHAKSMRRIILASVTAQLYNVFPRYFKKRHDFRKKKVIEYKTCVLGFPTTFI